MKRNIFSKSSLVLATAAIIVSTSISAFAQCDHKGMKQDKDSLKNCCGIPNLTADQKTKIDGLKTKHIKEVTPIQNELAEKRAHLNTLESVDKPDMSEINKTIDEISTLDAKLMKLRVSHKIEVASLLTDEQKVAFNAHHKNGMGNHDGMRMNKEGKGKCAGCPNHKMK